MPNIAASPLDLEGVQLPMQTEATADAYPTEHLFQMLSEGQLHQIVFAVDVGKGHVRARRSVSACSAHRGFTFRPIESPCIGYLKPATP